MLRQACAASAALAVVGCGTSIYLGVSPGPPGPVEGSGPANGSPGCGKAWTQANGVFLKQAAVTIPGGIRLDGTPLSGADTVRSYWVLVPNNYDPNTAYRVIFEGVGCTSVGSAGYPYQKIDNGDAIQVGLDPDPDRLDTCYDDQNPNSNDFYFFPWLKNEIENELCVDASREFISGYSSGAYLANQFGCAFPDKLRGQVLVSGGEPPQQPPCVDHPIAAFFFHDLDDKDNHYDLVLPACERTLKQNGCSQTDCSNPVDGGGLAPYPLPAGVTPPQGAPLTCSQFVGCPARYPVVFCTTARLGHNDQLWIYPAFWDFIKNLN